MRQVSLANLVDKDLMISVDPDKFQQVIINLLDNAITYNHPSGKVDIQASKTESQVTMTISDTGIGIPLEHISRIFERFYRIDPARSEKTGGRGLGLAIAKSILELHKGNISVTSSPSGTAFTLSFPV